MKNPHDPDAEVTKMKDGATHLAYKAEQAVDLDTGAIVAITTHGGATGDTESIETTLPEAGLAIANQIDTATAEGQYPVHAQGLQEVVTDKGYHSDASLQTIEAMEGGCHAVSGRCSAFIHPRGNDGVVRLDV